MWAPASAWLTASFASSLRVSSFMTLPSASSLPQWPWLVYSHIQTSVMMYICGACARMMRQASCTTPCSSQAVEPISSFAAGSPKSST